MPASKEYQIELPGRQVNYRLVPSKTARKLRIRVGPNGIEVVQPAGRKGTEVSAFLDRSRTWITDQLDRVERLSAIRRPERCQVGEILFLGRPTRVRIETTKTRSLGNMVEVIDNEIVVRRGARTRTPVAQGLENWLRRQARVEIEKHLKAFNARFRHQPRQVYVMGQRTKWGNCSAKKTLSFNWRLVLAPEFVLRYLVIHEVVHLVIPDHSAKFWLTVQSHCRETERARQWLCSNGHRLAVDLGQLFGKRSTIEAK